MRALLYLPLVLVLPFIWFAAVVSHLLRRVTLWGCDQLDDAADWIERGR